jgi:hypothetical protein
MILLKHAPKGQQLAGQIPYTGAAVALFVLGPLAFVAQILRMALVTVTVDPKSGLVLRSGRQVSWQEIEGVEFAGLRFVSDRVVIHFLVDLLRSLTSRIPGFGLMSLLRIALMALLGCLILAVATLSGVLLPIMLLLSPWEPRVVVLTRDGRRLVWRDLGHEVDFVQCVERGLRDAATADQGPLPDVAAE